MANTIKQLEDLLISKITALVSAPGIARFASVINETEKEFNIEEIATFPVAGVSFSGDDNTGIKSRLVVDETYEVRIITKKTGSDSARAPHVLCDAVCLGIHGKDWNETDITPFQYQGRQRISGAEGQIQIYSMTFKTTHYLQIPTTT